MNRLLRMIALFPFLLSGALMLFACSDEPRSAVAGSLETQPADTASGEEAATGAAERDDVIARVGDEAITFGEINVMLNSAAVVGLSIPALGTPERDTVRITLLDKFVDANLIYLDALRKGVDKEPQYRHDLGRLTRGMLAELYVLKQLGDVTVSDDRNRDLLQAVGRTGYGIHPRGPHADRIGTAQAKNSRHGERRSANSCARALTSRSMRIISSRRATMGVLTMFRSAEVGDETITWGEIGGMLIAAGIAATAQGPPRHGGGRASDASCSVKSIPA